MDPLRDLLMDLDLLKVAGVLTYLIGIAALFVIPAKRKPGEATAWLLLIFLGPFLGVILFLLLGTPKLSIWRRAQQRAIRAAKPRRNDLEVLADQIDGRSRPRAPHES